jgi:lipoprotein-anchoring transpeptidase ErfK/SrfK
MNRRHFLSGVLGVAGSLAATSTAQAEGFSTWFDSQHKDPVKSKSGWRFSKKTPARVRAAASREQRRAAVTRYAGRKIVSYPSSEKPGTLIVVTGERALYQILGGGRAMRYSVAVGKEGFSWAGTARVGMKREWPTWTPPAEMIDRKPEYAEWVDGMPGGPENPLGARAMYLFDRSGDTGFRIHGTNNPASIGTAASSGCIRMLNNEVTELYSKTPIGTKVIVR